VLPRPEGWHGTGVGMVVMAVICYAFVLATPIGVIAAIDGDPMGVPVFAFGATLGAVSCTLVTPHLGRLATSPEGLVLPYSRLVASAMPVGGAGMGLALLTIPDSSWWPRPVGALILAGTAWAAVRARGRYAVVLGSGGVRLYQGRRTSSAGWPRDVEAYDKVSYNNKVTTYHPHVRVGRLPVPVWMLSMPPVVTYWTLRYYARHPEARVELANGRAYRRVRERDLLD
jgi:hypothetical protein